MDEFGMNNDAFETGTNDTKVRQRKRSTDSTARDAASTTARSRSAGAQQRRTASRRKQPEPKPRYTLVDFLFDRRTHMGLGIVLVIIALAMAVMTISHLAHGGADQSLASGRPLSELAAQADQVQNVGGPVGAKLSHWLMSDGLGIGAFVLVVWIGIIGLSLIGAMRCNFWSLTFRCLFTAVAASVIVGLVTYNLPTYTHWGGAHGRYINTILLKYTSWLGTVAVSLALAGLLVSVYLNPLLRARRYMREKVEATRAMRRERAERQERQGLQPVSAADSEPAAAATPAESRPISFDSPSDSIDTGFDIDDRFGDSDSDVSDETDDTGDTTIHDSSTQAAAAGDTAAGDASSHEPAFEINVPAEVEQRPDNVPAPGEHTGLDLPYDPHADLSSFRMPGIDLLTLRDTGHVIDEREQAENKDMIVQTLKSYKIEIDRIDATVGPTVTLYEIVPAEGVRIAQIKNLEDDIALSLAALGIRIIAPIPGKGTIGIEVPNREPRTVSIRTVLGSRKYAECRMKLPMAMGTTISDDVFIRDLADMPHLLVAGGSGQGKSVGLNCIIASLLYFKHPSELKLVLIDPKMVEFSRYSRLQNHYLARIPGAEDPIVTDPAEALATLNSLCVEMDNRYRLLRDAGAVKVEEYNKKFVSRQLNPEDGHRYLPYIVIIVDEFADLIMTAGKEVSSHIARIAQKARAVGMHMIIATQRPSTDVITGMIKANFLGRIAFRVQQRVDSMTILDRPGANQLIGRGDMLFSHNGKMERVQCAFIDSDEIDRITTFVDDQIGFAEPYLLPEPHIEGAAADAAVFDPAHRDALFDDCARFTVTQATASTSSLQRRFGIGYNKAGKIMDQMEAAGIVGAAQGSKPRAVLVDSITLESILAR